MSEENITTSSVDFPAVNSNLDLVDALTALQGQLADARGRSLIDDSEAAAAEKELTWAIKEAIMPVPSKPALRDHLETAKDALSSNPLTASLIAAISQAEQSLDRLP